MPIFIQKSKSTKKNNSINNTKKRDKSFITQNSAIDSILQLQHTPDNQAVMRMVQAQRQERDSDPPRSNNEATPLG